MQIENKNIFVYITIIIVAQFLFIISFGTLSGAIIASPIAVELSTSGEKGTIQSKHNLTTDQIKALKNTTLEHMQEVDWWLWWPLLNSTAWVITSLFLGFMKMVKYNEGLVVFTYLPSIIWRRDNKWNPPGNIAIEIFTFLITIAVVHFVSRWMYSKRKKT